MWLTALLATLSTHRSGTLAYEEFRDVWLTLADVAAELERRGQEPLIKATVMGESVRPCIAALRQFKSRKPLFR